MIHIENEYVPFCPKTCEEGVEMLTRMHDEDDTPTEFMTGYRMGLRVGINAMNTIIKHSGSEVKE